MCHKCDKRFDMTPAQRRRDNAFLVLVPLLWIACWIALGVLWS